jgi:hypothetical protein
VGWFGFEVWLPQGWHRLGSGRLPSPEVDFLFFLTFEGAWEGGFRNVAWSKLGLELSAKAQATEIKNAQSSTVCGALYDLRCSHGTAQLPGGSRPS